MRSVCVVTVIVVSGCSGDVWVMIKVTWSFISSSRAATTIGMLVYLLSEGAIEILTSISCPVRKCSAFLQCPRDIGYDFSTASGLTYVDCFCRHTISGLYLMPHPRIKRESSFSFIFKTWMTACALFLILKRGD
ncbi:hypothetical protein [Bartonella sp. 1-1C]|uniref:hypothetical protein n=1 Tax=Bartonella sp. 1-1C TaxID=515256 RepID=UPI000C059D9D|nr:hypothetical protein [Bartonella sp. 1-1C]ATO56907.1 hypothetical protein B11Cv2_001200 [Bartonella sp. 1-1C]